MPKKNPVLKCYPSGIHVKAWCPFCEKWHNHGFVEAFKPGKILHYVAHCKNPDSPFHNGGYYLMLMTKGEREEIAKSLMII